MVDHKKSLKLSFGSLVDDAEGSIFVLGGEPKGERRRLLLLESPARMHGRNTARYLLRWRGGGGGALQRGKQLQELFKKRGWCADDLAGLRGAHDGMHCPFCFTFYLLVCQSNARRESASKTHPFRAKDSEGRTETLCHSGFSYVKLSKR